MGKNKRLGLNIKRRFIDLRNNGLDLHDIAKELNISITSARRLSILFNTGQLQRQVEIESLPHTAKTVHQLLEKAVATLKRKDLEALSPKELVKVIEMLAVVKNKLIASGPKEDGEDGFTELWNLVSSEPKDNLPMEGIRKG